MINKTSQSHGFDKLIHIFSKKEDFHEPKDIVDIGNHPSAENIKTKEEMDKVAYKTEIDEYNGLMGLISGVEGLTTNLKTHKISVAFLIDEMKKANPDGWQEDIKSLKDDISKADEKGGFKEVGWLLSEKISNTYINFLQKREDEAQGELKEKLQVIKEMVQDDLDFCAITHMNKSAVSFGGVSVDYAPDWYYLV